MIDFDINMAKYTKKIIDKAVYNLDSFCQWLFALRIIKLDEIVLHHEPYNYGQTAKFKFNFINPFTWIFVFSTIVSAIVIGVIKSILEQIKLIKNCVIIHFD